MRSARRLFGALAHIKMSDLHKLLYDNAIKCMELLHKILAVWCFLTLMVAFLPTGSDSAQLKLPILEFSVPYNSTRWIGGILIFVAGFFAQELLKKLEGICASLKDGEHLEAVLTYPSIATIGTPGQRGFSGLVLAFIQYSAGATLIPKMHLFGSDAHFGLAFLYCAPMLFFGSALNGWQRSICVR